MAYGCIVTAGSPGRTRDALKEAISLLKKYVLPEKEAHNNELSVEEQLEDQQKALTKAHGALELHHDFLKGAGLLSFNKSMVVMSPSMAVMAAFNDIMCPDDQCKRRRFTPRHLNRIIPIELACSPHPPNFRNCATKLVSMHFPESRAVNDTEAVNKALNEKISGKVEIRLPEECDDDEEKDKTEKAEAETPEEATNDIIVPKGSTWCVVLEIRSGMKTLPKDLVCETFGILVGSDNYKVNLKEAEYAVVVEVNNCFCGMSVIKDFHKFKKLNIKSVVSAKTIKTTMTAASSE